MSTNNQISDGRDRCDACGALLILTCSIGAYRFCRKCASGTCREEALQIAKHKHKEKLIHILDQINK